MRKYYTILFFSLLLSFHTAIAQNNQSGTISQIKVIEKELKVISKNIEGKIGDPKQQEVRLFQLKAKLEKLGNDQGVFLSGSLLMELYGLQNRNKDVIKLVSELKKMAQGKKDPYGHIATIYRRNALALGYLGLDDASIKDFKTAIKFAETIENSNTRLYYLSLNYENMTVYYENKQMEDSLLYYRLKSLEEAKKIRDNNGVVSNDLKYDQIAFCNMAIGVSYLSKTDTKESIALAEKYLLEGLKIHENKAYNILPTNKITMLNQVSWLYLEKEEYQKSIDYAQRALGLEKRIHNVPNRMDSFEFLTEAYVGIGNKEKSKFFLEKYGHLRDSLNVAMKNNADTTMKGEVEKVQKDQNETTRKQWMLVIFVVLSIEIFTLTFWIREKKLMKRKYGMIISKLKDEALNKTTNIITEVQTRGKNTISNQTEINLLSKLNDFENEQLFLNNDISLTSLANSFNTNTKYLTELIKKYRSQNFNNYINSLRINYIIHKLYNEPRYRDYKISYLSEVSGFISYQVFILAFKNVHGVTPSYFIQSLKEEDSDINIPKTKGEQS